MKPQPATTPTAMKGQIRLQGRETLRPHAFSCWIPVLLGAFFYFNKGARAVSKQLGLAKVPKLQQNTIFTRYYMVDYHNT
jgi:hypothetical protein